jgi:hypothetical protein
MMYGMDFVPLSEIDRLKQLRCRVHEVIAITVDETLITSNWA